MRSRRSSSASAGLWPPSLPRKQLGAGGGDEDRVLVVGGEDAVLRRQRPAVRILDQPRLRHRDDRLDGDDLAVLEAIALVRVEVVEDVRRLVDGAADTVPGDLA